MEIAMFKVGDRVRFVGPVTWMAYVSPGDVGIIEAVYPSGITGDGEASAEVRIDGSPTWVLPCASLESLNVSQDDHYMALTKSAVARESRDAHELDYLLGDDMGFKTVPQWAQDCAEQMEQETTARDNDPVVQPNHYARYAIEPATFIMANRLPFAVGNVVKYVLRYDAKAGREDIRKAIRYCEMILEGMDRDDRVKAGEEASAVWARML